MGHIRLIIPILLPRPLVSEQEQQFLALVVHGDDVHLTYMMRSQVGDGLAPVEHGRELQHDMVGAGEQAGHHGDDVGRAVGEGKIFTVYQFPVYDAGCAVGVAAGRVEVDEGGGWRVESGGRREDRGGSSFCIGTDGGDIVEAQEPEIVGGDGAELFVALHVDGFGEAFGHESEVRAEAAGEIK